MPKPEASAPPPDVESLRVRKALEEIMPRILEDYVATGEAMRVALAAQEYETIANLAHQIKGSGGSCGFPHISEMGLNIERAVTGRNDVVISLALERFESSLKAIEGLSA